MTFISVLLILLVFITRLFVLKEYRDRQEKIEIGK